MTRCMLRSIIVGSALLALPSFATAQTSRVEPKSAPVPANCIRAIDESKVTSAKKANADQDKKAIDESKVTSAEKVNTNRGGEEIRLRDVIELEIGNLSTVLAECKGQAIVLYLNGHSMSGVTPGPLTAPGSGKLRFTLKFVHDADRTWSRILGHPEFKARPVRVSFGVDGLYPASSDAMLDLETIGNRWFAIWLVIFLATLIGFVVCVKTTNIIRDGTPASQEAGVRPTYSLAKTQAAVWFFVIFGAYMFIGLITGNFTSSLNATALILLALGFGTVVGSAVIDASKAADAEAKAVLAVHNAQKELEDVHNRIEAIDVSLAQPATATLTAEGKATLLEERARLNLAQMSAESRLKKARGENQHFLKDIMSDANGVSLHRFQMAAFTVVLAIVFIKGVYENLDMPTFDTAQMGLLGLSAATYLGLKIPEATSITRS